MRTIVGHCHRRNPPGRLGGNARAGATARAPGWVCLIGLSVPVLRSCGNVLLVFSIISLPASLRCAPSWGARDGSPRSAARGCAAVGLRARGRAGRDCSTGISAGAGISTSISAGAGISTSREEGQASAPAERRGRHQHQQRGGAGSGTDLPCHALCPAMLCPVLCRAMLTRLEELPWFLLPLASLASRRDPSPSRRSPSCLEARPSPPAASMVGALRATPSSCLEAASMEPIWRDMRTSMGGRGWGDPRARGQDTSASSPRGRLASEWGAALSSAQEAPSLPACTQGTVAGNGIAPRALLRRHALGQAGGGPSHRKQAGSGLGRCC